MKAHDLEIIGAQSTAESLQLGDGAIVDYFDTDVTLAGNSDTRVATQKAVKTYVDAAVPGTGNLIFQLDSKVEVTDTGADGQVEVVIDNNQAILVKEADAETNYTVLMTNAGNTGGLLKLDLDGHGVDESYSAFEISNVSAVAYDAYDYINAIWSKTHIAGAALVGNAIDIYGAEFATWTNGTGFYNSIYGGGAYADIRSDATVDYITGFSTLARQQAAGTKASSSLISSEHLAYVYGSGLIDEAKAEHNFIDVDASGQVTDLYGSWTQVGVAAGATVADIYLDRMQFTGTGGATGTVYGLYVEGADTNYLEGDLQITGDLFIDGTTFVVNNQEVTTSDNIIVVNNGEVGSGVTAGSAGIQVDRGQLTDYQFLFVEADDNFQVGEIGSLQAVATRQDAPADGGVPFWNDGSTRFDNSASLKADSSGHLYSADSVNHYFGTDNDMNIMHTGTYGQIDCNTGGLYIDGATGSDIWFRIGATLAMKVNSSNNVEVTNHLTIDGTGQWNAGSTPAGTSALEYNGYLYATRVYGAVWG